MEQLQSLRFEETVFRKQLWGWLQFDDDVRAVRGAQLLVGRVALGVVGFGAGKTAPHNLKR